MVDACFGRRRLWYAVREQRRRRERGRNKWLKTAFKSVLMRRLVLGYPYPTRAFETRPTARLGAKNTPSRGDLMLFRRALCPDTRSHLDTTHPHDWYIYPTGIVKHAKDCTGCEAVRRSLEEEFGQG